ncbi:uncharacterized protein LOC134530746 [Bacillus rossius redtenbacheri]|uniref:uncharacterized protein LOC134530746 n=1 Tax=Bacillus rossius redtenbacheri TaxID=93214 RepID=UPI002FDDD8E9
MRVQEKSYASCAKMTEERSMNGGPDGPSENKRGFGLSNADGTQSPNLTASVDNDKTNAVGGGRLKFFKDGKFILELSHRKDGERMAWVPVSKKTCWPSASVSTAGTPRQESSTSLSVSDDNSSVQSSPWQRDHCWKQSSPRRGVGKEMTFFMQPSKHIRHVRNLHLFSHTLRRKRRCPYDSAEVPVTMDRNGTTSARLARVKREAPSPEKLNLLIQSLWERVNSASDGAGTSVLVQNHTRTISVTVGRMDPSIISPRKRILREMERVSLEDLGSSKRQRAHTTCALPVDNNVGGNSCSTTIQTSKGSIGSYSITSLLGPGRKEEQPSAEPSFLRTLLRSPPPSPEHSPRHRSAAPAVSPGPGLRPAPVVPSMGASPHLTPFLSPSLLYPTYLPHPHTSTHPYYPVLPPVPSPFRSSPIPALWANYSLSSLPPPPRGALYPGHSAPLSPCPWGPLTPHPLDDFKKDDPSSDVPLNLSKHAG